MQEFLTEQQKEVMEANRSFYSAFEKLSWNNMKECWDQTPDVICIHPQQPSLVGFEDIMESWKMIFAGTSYMEIDVQDIRIMAGMDLAVVHCTESVMAVSAGQTNRGQVRATNVFRKVDDSWKIILHHAGP
ncbi:MAG TPA: hypothetical protein DEA96_00015 [Leptospiraceae bacterium]|nr:hypothetical protein [Spirochaetaceae bacterium]HBS03317.1 hypothetical protein [Leptospiraceae bacterium]|tara:strand:+ start:16408 stop:16800 length:393 start_codon:yes stop_codon:yes gene_type:complete